jgi:uncharacterized protein YqeY
VSLRQTLADDVKAAMKAGDRPRIECLRMLRARVLEHEVALRPERGADHQATDDEVLQVLAAYAKQRREAIEEFRRGRRDDLVAREEAELAIVQSYLPQPLGEAAVRALVEAAIAELGATKPTELGAVMKRVLPAVQGRADGKLVSQIARELLAR